MGPSGLRLSVDGTGSGERCVKPCCGLFDMIVFDRARKNREEEEETKRWIIDSLDLEENEKLMIR